jgi:hypothetical protein
MAARRTIEKGATKDIWRLLDDAQRAPPPQAALDGESKPTDGACVARSGFKPHASGVCTCLPAASLRYDR